MFTKPADFENLWGICFGGIPSRKTYNKVLSYTSDGKNYTISNGENLVTFKSEAEANEASKKLDAKKNKNFAKMELRPIKYLVRRGFKITGLNKLEKGIFPTGYFNDYHFETNEEDANEKAKNFSPPVSLSSTVKVQLSPEDEIALMERKIARLKAEMASKQAPVATATK